MYKSSEEDKWCESTGRRNAKIKFFEAIYQKKYMLNPELIQGGVEALGEIEKAQTKYDEKDCWYIVINPDESLPDFDRYKFVEKCKRACEKKWIHTCKLWFEFREHTRYGSGIHANFAIGKSRYPMSRVKNEFYNTFKKYIGDDPKYRDNYICVQRARKSEWQNICDYQRSKGKYEADKITLAINNIDEFYLFGKDVDHYK